MSAMSRANQTLKSKKISFFDFVLYIALCRRCYKLPRSVILCRHAVLRRRIFAPRRINGEKMCTLFIYEKKFTPISALFLIYFFGRVACGAIV